ncbi:MAG: T9SS type A sorting domain-containing protein, partial [Hymenobacter sp.]|nr:T9SS type A sorting domain-containing protein [Hymenobacter sp.]
GFRIQGNNRNVTLTAATNQPGGCAVNGVGTVDPAYNGVGIAINGRGAAATAHPHDLWIRNNEVFECGQAGISAIQADYVTIENNLVYNNSWYTIYGSSGISILSSWNTDLTTGNVRTIVRNNRCFGNELRVPWYQASASTCKGFTDGNGIIIDSNVDAPAYTGRTLVANNLVVDNGGAGITTFRSDHVDIINNTLYQNAKTPVYSQGDLVISTGKDILAQNNLVFSVATKTRGSVKNITGPVTLNANLFFGGNGFTAFNNAGGTYTNTNTATTNPQLAGPTTDVSTANFRLLGTSPAINRGVNNLLPATDLDGNPRLVGPLPDLGAYELNPTVAAATTAWLGGGTTDWNTAANWSAGVPAGTFDASISANAAPYPVIAGNAAVLNLSIGTGASLTMSGGTLNVKGNVSNSGTFGASAGTVRLSGTAPQSIGGSGSTQFWNLAIANITGAIQSGAVNIRGVLAPASGNLTTNGQTLTLLSDAAGTALVDNSGTGAVSGSATVQRFIDPSLNPGLGYRHYSAPVAGSTVADLTTAGFAPEVSQAAVYNSSATPAATTPFPTVFGYDQSRVSLANAYAPFDRGFVVLADLSAPLAVGRGYAVNIGASQLVDFVGPLTNGDQTLALTRNAAGSANDADAGWQLLGNPYPSPLDYSLVTASDRAGLDAAIYVYASTSQYGGTYRSYVNGIGNPVLPTGQGFFARVRSGQTSGSLTFRNSQRLVASSTAFQRTTDVRPVVQLELREASGGTDAFYAYAESGATPAFNTEFDALKLPNTTGLNLASVASTRESLAVDGQPAFTMSTVLPLTVGVPTAGTYTLAASALNNLPATLDAVLTDAATGQTVNLRQQPSYAFTMSAAQAANLLTGRFSLRFAARTNLANATALMAADVLLYPNPAQASFTVFVPVVAGASQVQVDLLNALGQVVRHQTTALPATGTRLAVDAGGLAAGIYTLRLRAGIATLAKRVVLQ